MARRHSRFTAHQAGLRIGLITNGSRLSDPRVADCVARTHTWVRIGMNAGTEANFVSITRDRDHTFPTFEKTPRTLRESAVDPDFRVGFNFVVTEQNHKEIRLAAEVAARSGAHYIRFEDSNPRRTDLCTSCFYRPQNELLEWLRRGDVDLAGTLAAYQVEVPATLHADFV
jgi:hypothetical protein